MVRTESDLQRMTKQEIKQWLTKHDQRLPAVDKLKSYYVERATEYFRLLQKEQSAMEHSSSSARSRERVKHGIKPARTKKKLKSDAQADSKSQSQSQSQSSSQVSRTPTSVRSKIVRTQRRRRHSSAADNNENDVNVPHSPSASLTRSKRKVHKVVRKTPTKQSPSLSRSIKKKRERVRRATADPVKLRELEQENDQKIGNQMNDDDDDDDDDDEDEEHQHDGEEDDGVGDIDIHDIAAASERTDNLLKRKFVVRQDPENMTISNLQTWLDDNSIDFKRGQKKSTYVALVRKHSMPLAGYFDVDKKHDLSPNHKQQQFSSPQTKKLKPSFASPARPAPLPRNLRMSPLTPQEEQKQNHTRSRLSHDRQRQNGGGGGGTCSVAKESANVAVDTEEEQKQNHSRSRLSHDRQRNGGGGGMLLTPALNKTGIQQIDTPSKLAMRDEIRSILNLGEDDDDPLYPAKEVDGVTPGGDDSYDADELENVLTDLRRAHEPQTVSPETVKVFTSSTLSAQKRAAAAAAAASTNENDHEDDDRKQQNVVMSSSVHPLYPAKEVDGVTPGGDDSYDADELENVLTDLRRAHEPQTVSPETVKVFTSSTLSAQKRAAAAAAAASTNEDEDDDRKQQNVVMSSSRTGFFSALMNKISPRKMTSPVAMQKSVNAVLGSTATKHKLNRTLPSPISSPAGSVDESPVVLPTYSKSEQKPKPKSSVFDDDDMPQTPAITNMSQFGSRSTERHNSHSQSHSHSSSSNNGNVLNPRRSTRLKQKYVQPAKLYNQPKPPSGNNNTSNVSSVAQMHTSNQRLSELSRNNHHLNQNINNRMNKQQPPASYAAAPAAGFCMQQPLDSPGVAPSIPPKFNPMNSVPFDSNLSSASATLANASKRNNSSTLRALLKWLFMAILVAIAAWSFVAFDAASTLSTAFDRVQDYISELMAEEQTFFCDSDSNVIAKFESEPHHHRHHRTYECVACPKHALLCQNGRAQCETNYILRDQKCILDGITVKFAFEIKNQAVKFLAQRRGRFVSEWASQCETNYILRDQKCILDGITVKFAFEIKNQAVKFLAQRRGRFECDEMADHNDGYSMTEDELFSNVEVVDQAKKFEAFAYFKKHVVTDSSLIGVDDRGHYFAYKSLKSPLCRAREWAWNNLLFLMATSCMLMLFASWYCQCKRRQTEKRRVKDMVSEIYKILEEYYRCDDNQHIPVDIIKQQIKPKSNTLWKRAENMIYKDARINKSVRMIDGIQRNCWKLLSMPLINHNLNHAPPSSSSSNHAQNVRSAQQPQPPPDFDFLQANQPRFPPHSKRPQSMW
eukprot:CAMPEP_0202732690 /NCGR_PEP_ID=MMETSP1385-20130828/187778_1 /ASSEMBLY_ACC=CAM_ASM_000861 /TAXON_ID=933848 /ORGANISM="Elphidium margaritaceum" /LENGTH=1303 /DNA_ID=CAMNT_0049399013 /DNA_START=174 /DNA_END=4088 /DNA_ORIENTATION=-